MTKRKSFTPAQVAAARLKMELAAADGRHVDPRIVEAANTKGAQRCDRPQGSPAEGAPPSRDRVTPAQIAAARLKIELAQADGRQVDPRILAIANARHGS